MNASPRIILVTGAARGVGAATALALHDCDLTPVLGLRRAPEVPQPVSVLRARGVDPMTVACDVTDPGEVAAAIKAIIDRYGALHGIGNNAARIDPTGLRPQRSRTTRFPRWLATAAPNRHTAARRPT